MPSKSEFAPNCYQTSYAVILFLLVVCSSANEAGLLHSAAPHTQLQEINEATHGAFPLPG